MGLERIYRPTLMRSFLSTARRIRYSNFLHFKGGGWPCTVKGKSSYIVTLHPKPTNRFILRQYRKELVGARIPGVMSELTYIQPDFLSWLKGREVLQLLSEVLSVYWLEINTHQSVTQIRLQLAHWGEWGTTFSSK